MSKLKIIKNALPHPDAWAALAFYMEETHGFPSHLTVDMANEKGFHVNMGYLDQMIKKKSMDDRERSKFVKAQQ